jgi:ketosteroid isomerase-like protein
MTEENVEVVRRAWEAAWVRNDNETALALYDPEVQIDLTAVPHVGQSRVYFGLEGVQEWLRDLLASFGEMKVEVEEWIDAGERVIAMVHNYGRGKRSGVAVDKPEAHLWTVRDGLLVRLQIFPTRSDALEAAGLSE